MHESRGWLDLEFIDGVDLSHIAAHLRASGQLPSEAAVTHLARSLLRGLEHAPWVVPLAGLSAILLLGIPVLIGWSLMRPSGDVEAVQASPPRPALQFDTGLAASDEMLSLFSRSKEVPGKPTYTEPMLRSMEANFQRQQGMDPASAAYIEGSCGQAVATFGDACPE